MACFVCAYGLVFEDGCDRVCVPGLVVVFFHLLHRVFPNDAWSGGWNGSECIVEGGRGKVHAPSPAQAVRQRPARPHEFARLKRSSRVLQRDLPLHTSRADIPPESCKEGAPLPERMLADALEQAATLPPQASALLKKLQKKDETTKIKALANLNEFIQADHTLARNIASQIATHYSKLASDPSSRVRESAANTIQLLARALGKYLAPHLKTIITPWLCAKHDPQREVRRAAELAFDAAFSTTQKYADALAFCHKDIVKGLSERVLATPPHLGGCEASSEGEVYAISVSSALRAGAHTLETLCQNSSHAAVADSLAQALSVQGVWRLSRSEAPLVRSALYSWAGKLAIQAPSQSEHLNSSVASMLIRGLSERSVICQAKVWESMLGALQADCALATALRSSTGDILNHLEGLLVKKCFGAVQTVTTSLLPICSLLPVALIPKSGLRSGVSPAAKLITAAWEGAASATSGEANLLRRAASELLLLLLASCANNLPHETSRGAQSCLLCMSSDMILLGLAEDRSGKLDQKNNLDEAIAHFFSAIAHSSIGVASFTAFVPALVRQCEAIIIADDSVAMRVASFLCTLRKDMRYDDDNNVSPPADALAIAVGGFWRRTLDRTRSNAKNNTGDLRALSKMLIALSDDFGALTLCSEQNSTLTHSLTFIPCGPSNLCIVTQPATVSLGSAFDFLVSDLLPWIGELFQLVEAHERDLDANAGGFRGEGQNYENEVEVVVEKDGDERDSTLMEAIDVAFQLCFQVICASAAAKVDQASETINVSHSSWRRLLHFCIGHLDRTMWINLGKLVNSIFVNLGESVGEKFACLELDELIDKACDAVFEKGSHNDAEEFIEVCAGFNNLLSDKRVGNILFCASKLLNASLADDEEILLAASAAIRLSCALTSKFTDITPGPIARVALVDLLASVTALLTSTASAGGWVQDMGGEAERRSEEGESLEYCTLSNEAFFAKLDLIEVEASLSAEVAQATGRPISGGTESFRVEGVLASTQLISVKVLASDFWHETASLCLKSIEGAQSTSVDRLWSIIKSSIPNFLGRDGLWYDSAKCWAWLTVALLEIDQQRALYEIGSIIGPKMWSHDGDKAPGFTWRLPILTMYLFRMISQSKLTIGIDQYMIADEELLGQQGCILLLKLLDFYHDHCATDSAAQAVAETLLASGASHAPPALLAQYIACELLPHLCSNGEGYVPIAKKALERALCEDSSRASLCTFHTLLRCVLWKHGDSTLRTLRADDILSSQHLQRRFSEATTCREPVFIIVASCLGFVESEATLKDVQIPSAIRNISSGAVDNFITLTLGPSTSARAALARAGQIDAQGDIILARSASIALRKLHLLLGSHRVTEASLVDKMLERMQALALGIASEAQNDAAFELRRALCIGVGALLSNRCEWTTDISSHVRWIHATTEGVLRQSISQATEERKSSSTCARPVRERLDILVRCGDVASAFISGHHFATSPILVDDSDASTDAGASHVARGMRLLQLGISLLGADAELAASLHCAQHSLTTILHFLRTLAPSDLPPPSKLIALVPLLGAISPKVRCLAFSLIARGLDSEHAASTTFEVKDVGNENGEAMSGPLFFDSLLPEGGPSLLTLMRGCDKSARLYAWACTLNLLRLAVPPVAGRLTLYLQESNLLTSILQTLLPGLKLTPKRRNPLPSIAAVCEEVLSSGSAPPSNEQLIESLYMQLLQRLPSLVRRWWLALSSREAHATMEHYTEARASPQLLQLEVDAIKAHEAKTSAANNNHVEDSDDEGSFHVRARANTRQIAATFEYEGCSMQLVITLSSAHPLGPVEIECISLAGVTTKQWQRWQRSMSTMLLGQNGSIADALDLWRDNVKRVFQGVEECPICYAIVEGTTRALPRLTCVTCKKKFHSACIYKWFNSSGKSTCPLCQSQFS